MVQRCFGVAVVGGGSAEGLLSGALTMSEYLARHPLCQKKSPGIQVPTVRICEVISRSLSLGR